MRTIEQNLEVIATSLERMASLLEATSGVAIAGQLQEMVIKGAASQQAQATEDLLKKKSDEEAQRKREEAAEAKAQKAKEEEKRRAAEEEKRRLAEEEAAAAALDAVEEKAPEPKVTLDDVRAALKQYRDTQGAPAMLELLKSFGVDAIAKLKPDQYVELYNKARAGV